MARGPLGNNRPTNAGPLTYEEDMPPALPRGYTPPKITNHKGREDYWNDWKNPSSQVGVPASLRGVTGIYYPERRWVVVDDRIEIHHTVMLDESKDADSAIPDMRDEPIIPFATDYVGDAGENVIGLQGIVDSYDDAVNYWQSFVSIPETGSLLIHDEPDIDAGGKPSVTGVYDMCYPLKVLGLEPQSICIIKHKYRRVIEAERRVMLSKIYKEMALGDVLPGRKFTRNNDVRAE